MMCFSSFKPFLVLTLLCTLSFSSHAVASTSASESSISWDSYRAYLQTSILTGFASRKVVMANLKSAESALYDWKTSCSRQDTQRLLKIVAYGERSLKVQLPYGIDFIASDFSSKLAEAKTLALHRQCEKFSGLNLWSQELRKTKEAIQ